MGVRIPFQDEGENGAPMFAGTDIPTIDDLWFQAMIRSDHGPAIT